MSTIITKKQFPTTISTRPRSPAVPSPLEVGKVAELANAAAMVRYGETTRAGAPSPPPPVPATASTSSPCPWTLRRSCTPWAASPAPSTAARAVPREHGILACRVIDRPIRPLFPYDFRNDVVRHLHRHERGPRLLPRDRRHDRRLRRPGHLRHPLERPHRLR